MFHGRELNRKINRIHERSLRIVLKDYNSSFNGLLKMNKSVCIHRINIQSLAIELFKVKENLSNTITSDTLPNKTLNYDLRSQTVFFFRNTVNTTKFGLNSLRYFASEVWSMIPTDIKSSSNAEMFKTKIRKRKPFVKICCIDLDMLTWLMTNPFVSSVLILVIAGPRNRFTYKLEGCCKILQIL